MRGVYEVIREEAPDALYNPIECLWGVDFYISATNQSLNTQKLDALKEFADVFAPSYNLSFFVFPGDWRALNERYKPYERPILMHELGIIGNYIDLDTELRYEGTRIGTDYYAAVRRYLKENGVLPMARRYFENSCKWMAAVHKHNLETARKCSYIQGYNFLGDANQTYHRGGYPCGIMNEFYELKPGETAENFLKSNGESVILLDLARRRNLTVGQKCSYAVLSSLYGPGSLADGTLYWYLAGSDKRVYDGGSFSAKNVANGSVETIGNIEFAAPHVDKPVKLTLHARLSGGEYELTNDWDLWVFPKTTAPDLSTASIRVVSELDSDSLKSLSEGGKVVLLGGKPFPTLPTSFSPAPTGRTEGNLATVIADHPALGDFPHEGWCDWQFEPMLENATTVVFNDTGLPFQPIIDVASSFKYVRRQSNLFELAVGSGKLLVCTLNLNQSDPAAEYLLRGLLSYAASDAFQPKPSVTADAIEKLRDMKPLRINSKSNAPIKSRNPLIGFLDFHKPFAGQLHRRPGKLAHIAALAQILERDLGAPHARQQHRPERRPHSR